MSKTVIVPAWLLVSVTALLVFDAAAFDMRQQALTDGANAERAVNSFLARKKEEKEAKERAAQMEQLADANRRVATWQKVARQLEEDRANVTAMWRALRDGREVAPMPRAK